MDNPGPIVSAIQKGFVIGNHLYSHQRSSELDFTTIIEEIQRTETMIDAAHLVAENRVSKTASVPTYGQRMRSGNC